MEPKDYLRCASRLCKKMNGYVKEDLIVIEADIQFSVSKYKKNGGSSSTSSFYTMRNVVFSKDLLNKKKMDLIFKHKFGSIEDLKRKYYQTDYDYSTNKRMSISVGYKTKVNYECNMIYLYNELKVKNSKYGFGTENFENKCAIETYWNSESDEGKKRAYKGAKNNDIFSHLIVTL